MLIKQGEPRDAGFFIIVLYKDKSAARRGATTGAKSLSRPRPRRPSVAPSPPALHRPGTVAPQHAGAPVLRPARLCIAARDPERRKGPLAPCGFERYSGRRSRAHVHHRPGVDESVVKRDYLLTNRPCEFTVTAVGEVKVLVNDARQRLADRFDRRGGGWPTVHRGQRCINGAAAARVGAAR